MAWGERMRERWVSGPWGARLGAHEKIHPGPGRPRLSLAGPLCGAADAAHARGVHARRVSTVCAQAGRTRGPRPRPVNAEAHDAALSLPHATRARAAAGAHGAEPCACTRHPAAQRRARVPPAARGAAAAAKPSEAPQRAARGRLPLAAPAALRPGGAGKTRRISPRRAEARQSRACPPQAGLFNTSRVPASRHTTLGVRLFQESTFKLARAVLTNWQKASHTTVAALFITSTASQNRFSWGFPPCSHS